MMKKFILSSLLATVALGGATVAFAQNTMEANVSVGVKASTSKAALLNDIRVEAKEKIQDLREKIASTSSKDEKKENLRDRAKVRIEAKFKRMFLRLQATIDREKLIMIRLNSRIAKVKAAGGNTAISEKFSADAKKHLDEAQASLDLLKATAVSDFELNAQIAASTTNASLTGETMKKMKSVESDVEKHLKEAHQALTNSLKGLKGMSGTNMNASSTTEVHATTTSN